jgi:hypothetical protein
MPGGRPAARRPGWSSSAPATARSWPISGARPRRCAGFQAALEVHLVETSPALRLLQAERLAPIERLQWHGDLAEVPADRPLLVIANELFDALPIRQFIKEACGLARDRGGARCRAGGSASAAPARPSPWAPGCPCGLPPGSVLELSPARDALMAELAERLGVQGRPGADHRLRRVLEPTPGSTLQAVHRHQKVAPLTRPGEVDLSSRVAFGPLARIAPGGRAPGVRPDPARGFPGPGSAPGSGSPSSCAGRRRPRPRPSRPGTGGSPRPTAWARSSRSWRSRAGRWCRRVRGRGGGGLKLEGLVARRARRHHPRVLRPRGRGQPRALCQSQCLLAQRRPRRQRAREPPAGDRRARRRRPAVVDRAPGAWRALRDRRCRLRSARATRGGRAGDGARPGWCSGSPRPTARRSCLPTRRPA